MRTTWTEESILDAIRRLAKKLRKRPTHHQLLGKYKSEFRRDVFSNFGSYKEAIDRADVEDLLASLPPLPPRPDRPEPITLNLTSWPKKRHGVRVCFCVDAEDQIHSAWRREGQQQVQGPENIDSRTLFWAANPPHRYDVMKWFVDHGHEVLEHDKLEEPERTTRLAEDAAFFGYDAHPLPETPRNLIGQLPRPALQQDPPRRLSRDQLRSMHDKRGAQLTRDMLDEAPEMDWF